MRVQFPQTVFAFSAVTVCVLVYLFYAQNAQLANGVLSVEKNIFNQSAHPGDIKSDVHQLSFAPMMISSKRNTSFDYRAEMKELNDVRVPMDDPRLVQIIRDYYIDPPSLEPYNLENPESLEYSKGQAPFVDSRLNYIEGGFFVEAGALNGERGSNTLFFEKVRKWNGLLVEADPESYAILKSKHRKAFSINACLSIQNYSSVVTFNKGFNFGRIYDNKEAMNWVKRIGKNLPVNTIQVQCFPLYSILLALGQTNVDFFSLDVEGDELHVLQTIPFDKVNIKMMTVEFAHIIGGGRALMSFVKSKGYDSLLKVQRLDGGVNDIIFRRKGLSH
ncbi:hypothetical protein CHS0354_017393 [Potamilus streckersoni]|uniref:Methyltransferase FkbM domain-containing protein n=1 Tax=Potamilus streckersoni TaxID=2493646 RepID=A0AAE0W6A0_9BIVA|nr:hypothetical protein CHS0354_017393 [Potamilus streckersoni]